jgi:SAM-dependent methyltransferase
MNEYVFGVDSDESAQLDEFRQKISDASDVSEDIARAFAMRCLYEAPPLDSNTRVLAESLCPKFPWLMSLFQLTVFEPYEEAQLAESIPTLHPVHDDGSLAVQAQYEANPYPRWKTPPTPPRSRLLQIFHRDFSQRPGSPAASQPPRLLVAGCGTGFEPIDIARRDDSVSITAIDLSRRSLAYAVRKASQLGCTNIDFYEGDILDLPKTSWTFDFIICTGVLHHMTDPMAGWNVLRDSLAENGMMRISLYSAHARRVIRAARDLVDPREQGAQAEDIRRFRQSILHDNSEPELEVLLSSDDFYSMSGCRDLVFHVQEHQFTLPQIESALEELKLKFCGFDIANAAVIQAFQSRYPGSESLLDLTSWDEFENAHPHVFSGMYQFWCEPG